MDRKKITKIKNTSFVVAFDGKEHYIIKNGELAYSGNEIIYVGDAYKGNADEEIDAKNGLVVPGFINMHTHLGASPVEKGFLEDKGSRNFYMSGLYEYLAVTQLDPEEQMAAYKFSLAEIIKKGSTTIFELGFIIDGADMIKLVGETGIRAYVGAVSNCGYFHTTDGRKVSYFWDENRGDRLLDRTLQLFETLDQSYEGRINVAINAGQVDTVSPRFLKEVRKAADKTGMVIQIHAGQAVNETITIMERHNTTPAEFLADNGIAGPKVMYGHYIMPCGHKWNRLLLGRELETIANTGTSVVHCPWVFGRRGIIMESFDRYIKMGINMAIGTDTFPQDIISEMGKAAVFSKIAECDPEKGTAAQAFNAATLGGAKALGRTDIGRLSVGAKADLLIIDTNNMEMCPLRDPIKALIYTGGSRHINKVVIDGKILVDNNRLIGVDEERIIKDMQKVGERMLERAPKKDWAHRTHEELSPWSFRIEN